ncbi:MAG: bacterial transcriptional activator domain-containing protein [Candidatus Dormibacteraeota bacterium]|nr:bacterial transcriptional activator domain-containing protein [Candidatus Dormibacteraeota bacterium]
MVIMLSLLAIWLLFVLLVPKRAVNSLGERLRATVQGHRVYVFAPPAELGRGLVLSGLGEGVRLIQLGLPVYLLCLWAEARGRRRRLAMPSTTTSPFPPAPKVHPPVRRQYVLPPMAWRREWEATLRSKGAKADGPVVSVTTPPGSEPTQPSPGALTIRSLGTLQLVYAGEDLTSRLLRAPTLSFLWLFLLTHAAARPGAKVHRQVLAEEAFPGIDFEQQRGRLRGRLSDLQHDLPSVLADRVKVDGDLLRLDLETAEFDVTRLRRVVDDLAAGTGLLPEAGIKAIETAIGDCGGEYLPVWDEVERQTTGGRGSAGDLVRAVRTLTEDFHIQLLVRLADHYRARRDVPQAIPLLEEVHRRRPEREDVAHMLIGDYRETGQTMRAGQLETAYRSDFVQAPRRTE